MKAETLTNAVEEHYAAVARGEVSACGGPKDQVAHAIGYSDEELAIAGGPAQRRLGFATCGLLGRITPLAPRRRHLDPRPLRL